MYADADFVGIEKDRGKVISVVLVSAYNVNYTVIRIRSLVKRVYSYRDQEDGITFLRAARKIDRSCGLVSAGSNNHLFSSNLAGEVLCAPLFLKKR